MVGQNIVSPGPALCGLETRVALVQLLHVVTLEGVWNDEPPSTEEQTTVTHEFLSHGVEWPQVTWHLPKCIGPACSHDLRETPAHRISQRLTLQFLNPVRASIDKGPGALFQSERSGTQPL